MHIFLKKIFCKNGDLSHGIESTLDIQAIEEMFEPPNISWGERLLGVSFTPILTRYDWRILDVYLEHHPS